MKESKSYQLILPIESGNQYVLDNILRKPLKINKVMNIVNKAKSLDFEIAADFVIGSPGETWDQIWDSVRFAEEMDVDMVSFHIATPLPKTELYSLALKHNALAKDFSFTNYQGFGFGKGCITTDEFAPQQLHMLRALEWDRINFKNLNKKKRFAKMSGITLAELENWRKNSIRNLGIYFPKTSDNS